MKISHYFLLGAAALFVLLLMCIQFSYGIEAFVNSPSDPAPAGVQQPCKMAGYSSPLFPGKRLYTASGCKAIDGAIFNPDTGACYALWDPKGNATPSNMAINYNIVCSDLGFDTPAPDECYINNDRTTAPLGVPNGSVPNRPDSEAKYRVYTKDECAQLGGNVTEKAPPSGSDGQDRYFCQLAKMNVNLGIACASLNYSKNAPSNTASSTITAALGAGTPASSACPAPQPCPQCPACPTCPPPQACPPLPPPCPAPPPIPVCPPPPPPMPCPRYEPTNAWTNWSSN